MFPGAILYAKQVGSDVYAEVRGLRGKLSKEVVVAGSKVRIERLAPPPCMLVEVI